MRGNESQFMQSYLNNRKQYVHYKYNKLSESWSSGLNPKTTTIQR